MSKPIPDKAEIALEYPDKFYAGTFERSSRFEAHLEPTGLALTLERPGAEASPIWPPASERFPRTTFIAASSRMRSPRCSRLLTGLNPLCRSGTDLRVVPTCHGLC